VRKQVEALKHHADFATNRIQIAHIVIQLDAIDDDVAAIVFFEAIERAQESRLARARRPDDGRDLAFIKSRRHAPQSMESTVMLFNVARFDDGFVLLHRHLLSACGRHRV